MTPVDNTSPSPVALREITLDFKSGPINRRQTLVSSLLSGLVSSVALSESAKAEMTSLPIDPKALSARDLSARDLSARTLSAPFSDWALQSKGPPDLEPTQAGRLEVASWPQPDFTLELWPKGPPGALGTDIVETAEERSKDPSFHDRAMKGVARPRLCVFRPSKPNGASMLIMPGGAYWRIVIDHEGFQVAEFLKSLGVTAFVLFYRLPAEGWDKASDVPLMDAQRSMRLIHGLSEDLRLDPKRIGAMGFSAGGHVCGSLMTRYEAKVYEPVDAYDQRPTRPAITAPLYPVQSMDASIAHKDSRTRLLGPSPSASDIRLYSPQYQITPATPPSFLCHAEDDQVVKIDNSLNLMNALRAKSVPTQSHFFAEGGHGFGMTRARQKPAGIWPQLFAGFLRQQGLIPQT